MKKGIVIALILGVIAVIVVLVSSMGGTDEIKVASDNSTSTYILKYKNVNITPGKIFDINKIDGEYTLSTIKSCAFEGEDHVYTFSDLEITANILEDNREKVYSVYFIDDSVSTNEGIKIGSTKDELLKSYSKYDEDDNYIRVNDGKVMISFYVLDDKVKEIEYTMVIS